MNMSSKLKGGVVALVLAASPGLANAGFTTFGDFTIAEGSVPGTVANTVIGDKLSGAYTEQLTIGIVPDAFGNLSFDTWGFATFSALYKNEGADIVDTQLGTFGAPGYLIRALFHSTGLYNVGTNLFTGQVATIDMYIDANKDTAVTFGADATIAAVLGATADDYLIGTASNPTKLAGIPGTPGAFDFVWDDFTLTSFGANPDGDKYFTAPRPFFLGINSNGDFDKPSFAPGTFNVTGDISAVYGSVPEPGTLALLGLGLLGLSSVGRRNKGNSI